MSAGASPGQVLQGSTRRAAELCGVAGDLGTIEPGKIADLIAVTDNPLEEISALRRVALVIQEGEVVVERIGATQSAGGPDT